MKFLNAVRDRISSRDSSGGQPAGMHSPTDEDAAAEAAPPSAGYDRLNAREVMDGLHHHSQTELEGIETYERSHKSRESVLDKLRWMRGSEPLPGYDALSVDEISAALADADLKAIKRVRSYERKFANRREVLEEVARVHHRRLEEQPADAVPAYQSLGGAAVNSPPAADKTQHPS